MIWPSNCIPRFVFKKREIHVQTKTYMQVFVVSLITAKTWNNSNVQQQVKGKSSVIYPYTGMPLNAIKDVMSQKQAEQKKRDSGGQPGWFNLYEILEMQNYCDRKEGSWCQESDEGDSTDCKVEQRQSLREGTILCHD